MKKLLTVSLLAMMAVGTARADIASTNYADTVAKNKADAAQAAAEATAASNLSTTIASYSTTAQMNAAIEAEATRATAAETALGTRIDNISAGELTIKKDAVTANEIKDGEVKTNEIADAAVTKAKLSEDVQASLNKADSAMQSIADGSVTKAMLDTTVQGSLDKADAAAPQATTYTKTEVDSAVADAKNAGTGAQSDLNTFKTTVSTTYATKTDVSTELAKKANNATTLTGYGITDAYTKTEVDAELAKKADNATTLAGYGITDAYTKAEVNAKISNEAVADEAAQKVTAPSIEYAQSMIDGSLTSSNSKISALEAKVGTTAVSTQISTAVGSLDGSDSTGTADGSYVVEVTQTDGKVASKTVAFDAEMSDTSTNAVQNKVVKSAIDTAKGEAITTAGSNTDAKIRALNLTAVSSMALPADCGTGVATCALVYDVDTNGLKWEAIMK